MGNRAGRKDCTLAREEQLTEALLAGPGNGERQESRASVFRLLALAKEEACVSSRHVCPDLTQTGQQPAQLW